MQLPDGSTNEKLIKWDTYFYNLCEDVAANTKCLSRAIGSVLVKDKTVVGTGYNGPPRGVPHCGERYLIDPELREYLKAKKINPDNPKHHEVCPRYTVGFKSGEGLQWCVAGHAERNALINSARMGISTKDATLYMSCGVPCTPCMVEIINAGVHEIVITKLEYYDPSARYLLKESNLRVRIYSHLCEHKGDVSKDLSHTAIKGICTDCGLAI